LPKPDADPHGCVEDFKKIENPNSILMFQEKADLI
jgi:hypothetical protein